MGQTKHSTEHPGVRYREHPTRRHNGRPDRYFFIRYYIAYNDHEEGLGWSSEGWTAKKAASVLHDLRKAHSTGTGHQSLAEMRAASRAKEEAEKQAVRHAQIQGMTLGDFLLKHYLPYAKKNKRTWRTDEIRINHRIVPALGFMPLRALNGADIAKFLDSLAEGGLAPATVKHHLAILRQAYKLAACTVIDGAALVDGQSPLEGMKAPKLFNARERFLSYDEADMLIDAAKGRNTDLHDAIVLSLNTGLRLGELLRLEWQNVDMVHGFITVMGDAQRKTGGKVKINAEVRAVLEARQATRDKTKALVLPPLLKGKQRENISHAFKDLVDELGLNKGVTDTRNRLVFHSLRHTFASWLAMAGTDIYRIKILMRHKTLAMTERYTHLIPDSANAAVHNLRPPKGS